MARTMLAITLTIKVQLAVALIKYGSLVEHEQMLGPTQQ